LTTWRLAHLLCFWVRIFGQSASVRLAISYPEADPGRCVFNNVSNPEHSRSTVPTLR
jgi:hypothetical protein